MSGRFWEAGEFPDALKNALLDWVSENVEDAFREGWGDGGPAGSIEEEGGRLLLRVIGPYKPDKDCDGGRLDCYSAVIDLLGALTDYADGYADQSAPTSEIQREDMRNRAVELQKFSFMVAALARYAAASAYKP